MICKVEWCDKAVRYNGLCNAHDLQMRRHGFIPEPRFCAWKDCDKQLRRDNESGYCKAHFCRYWAEQNEEYVKEQNRLKYLDNSDRIKERTRQWAKDNPEKARAQKAKRRALKRDAFVEDVLKPVVWDRDEGICFLCDLPADESRWDLAHVIPLSRGGEHSYANTAVSHPRCNNFQLGRLVEELDLESFLLTLERG